MVRVAGHTGVLKRGYRTVATLGPWSLSPDGAFTCDVLSDVDDASLNGSAPLGLVLHVGKSVWTWANVVASSTRPLRARVSGRPVVSGQSIGP